MKVNLSDHFTYGRLLRFTGPSIAMLVFIALYTLVDGFFVSNFAGESALAAVNLVWPLFMMLAAIGFVFGSGGSAFVSALMGGGRSEYAKGIFTMLVIAATVFGAVLMVVGLMFMEPIMRLLGADGELLDQCMMYSNILMAFLIPSIFSNMFSTFLIAAGRPNLGFWFALGSGVLLVFLDFLFVACWGWGVVGAGWATGMSYMISGIFPLFYFMKNRTSNLWFVAPVWSARALGKTFVNGLSEFVSNIATSIVGTLFNYQLMRIVGFQGVAAYSALMYINFVFVAVFFGFSQGAAPVTSYHYGAGHRDELKNLFRKEMTLIAVAGITMFALAQLLAAQVVGLIVGYDPDLFAMAMRGFRIFAWSFLLCGFSIYGSSLFTALNNGLVSALISFLRTLVFEAGSVLILPNYLGLDGVWFSTVVAEVFAVMLTTAFLIHYRKRYGYV